MIEKNLDLSKNHKIICFVDKINNIEEAKQNIMKWFKKELNIFEINHKQTKNQVNNIIETFKLVNGINILFCVNILNEGVHLPGIDCVMFLRKTKSNVIYNQQLGRVISSYIENPVIFDLVNNALNPEWGYNMIFKEKAKEQNKKVEELETKNGERLKITLEQIDLIKKLNKINNNKFTREQENFIIENKDKYTITEFAKMFNCSAPSIREVYKRHNIKDYKRKYDIKIDEDNEDFILENKDKYTVAEFTKMFNCSAPSIYNIYKKYNIKEYKGKRDIKIDKDFILENKDRYSATEFAEMFNCSGTSIYKIYKKYNIKEYKGKRDVKIDEDFILENKDKYTVTEFAEMFNCSDSLIYNIYKKYNIKEYKGKLGIKLDKNNENFILENKDKYTVAEFTKMFNCSDTPIYNIYKKYNIKEYKRNRGIKIDEDFILENKDKYTVTKFAKMFNYNKQSVYNIYKKYNIKEYKGKRDIKIDEDFILENKDKYTVAEFAKMFNCSDTPIYNIYKRYNIKDYKGKRIYK